MSYTFNIDYSDPPHVMREKAELALKEIKREKYDILLNFINSILPTKIPSFWKFKNINLENAIKNQDNLKRVYIENAEIFKTKFKITLSEKDLTAKTFVSNLTRCLKSIDYKLIKTQYESKTLYTIVNTA
jgi:hypothetical protein